jgi:hypothetical protein
MSEPENPFAFPFPGERAPDGTGIYEGSLGMTLRDWFAGQALVNSAICTGEAYDWELDAWFGKNSTGIMRHQIVAKQAGQYADAMLSERRQS